MKTLLGFSMLIILLSGCSARHIDAPPQHTTTLPDKQVSADTNADDPLIKEFGDIPEVRTYIRLQKKLGQGIGLTIDEAIEFYTAQVYLYPTPTAKETLKDLKADKKRYERLGIPADKTVLTERDDSAIPPPDFVLVNPFKDNADNPSPHNPLVQKFGNIPEVRTYIRLTQRMHNIGLNVNEAIELYTAEAHLYPTSDVKAKLKSWIKDKERYERLGILTDEPVLSVKRKPDSSDDTPTDTKETD